MDRPTFAERGHAATSGTEVALLATDLNCRHFLATLWRIELVLYQTVLAKPHTKGRHPLVHVERPRCSLHVVSEEGSGQVTIQGTYSLWRWVQNFVAFPSASTNARFRHPGMMHMTSCGGGGLERCPLFLNSWAHRRPQKSCAKKNRAHVHDATASHGHQNTVGPKHTLPILDVHRFHIAILCHSQYNTQYSEWLICCQTLHVRDCVLGLLAIASRWVFPQKEEYDPSGSL